MKAGRATRGAGRWRRRSAAPESRGALLEARDKDAELPQGGAAMLGLFRAALRGARGLRVVSAHELSPAPSHCTSLQGFMAVDRIPLTLPCSMLSSPSSLAGKD